MPRPMVFSVFAIILGAIVLAHSPAVAQDATPDISARHPVVGAWWTVNDAPGPGVNSAAIFHADGTYHEVDPNIGVGIGV